jgi:hypothetical protein
MTTTNTAGATNRSNPVKREIAVNASGGAEVLISASIATGYIEILEMPAEPYGGGAFTGQGLNYQRADENYANTYPLPPGAILAIGDSIRKNRCEGMPGWTYPDGTVRPPTPLVKVISATATATNVEVREWRQLESA